MFNIPNRPLSYVSDFEKTDCTILCLSFVVDQGNVTGKCVPKYVQGCSVDGYSRGGCKAINIKIATDPGSLI